MTHNQIVCAFISIFLVGTLGMTKEFYCPSNPSSFCQVLQSLEVGK